ncbi:SAF domain-containing protein [Spirillospora sp. NBC_01491]|uniref:SAF domain-containing protein n=1 Tax=Spirillospora sp. NBC_01491 TaxID=2976007 RepID=UPI002E34B69E|nr:SAF domain-containing protein [Spirillospora sp. NBC_01491]
MTPTGKTLPRPFASKAASGAGAPSPRRLARQRRPGWIAAGGMLIALAVSVNVYLFRSAGERVLVVKLARDVAVGQQISRTDLGVTRVAVDSTVPMLPERQLKEVVGQRAAVGLRKGMLLAATQLSARVSPQPGQALVTVPLKPSALPPGLAAGWHVRVVFSPGSQTQATGGGPRAGSPEVAPRDVPAVVDQVTGPDTEGTMTISLLMADSASSMAARQAAAGSVVLVVTERRG